MPLFKLTSFNPAIMNKYNTLSSKKGLIPPHRSNPYRKNGKRSTGPTLGYVMPPQHIISKLNTRQARTRWHNTRINMLYRRETNLQDGQNAKHSKNAKRQAKNNKIRKKGLERSFFKFIKKYFLCQLGVCS